MVSTASELGKRGPCRIFRHAFPPSIIKTLVLHVPGTVLGAAHPEINGCLQHGEGNHQRKSHCVKMLQSAVCAQQGMQGSYSPRPRNSGQQSRALRLHVIEGRPFPEAAEGRASHGAQLPVLAAAKQILLIDWWIDVKSYQRDC